MRYFSKSVFSSTATANCVNAYQDFIGGWGVRMPLADPRNQEINFNFDFDSFVRAGGAKLRGCEEDVILITWAPAVKFSGDCCSCGLCIFLLLYGCVLTWKWLCRLTLLLYTCFLDVVWPGQFIVIHLGFNSCSYLCALCVDFLHGF